jgi:phenylacetic acid degradation operon negative regulatory protein
MSSAPEGRPGGARALLYTVLGELVLPAGDSAWTSTLVATFDLLEVAEKNARQALARVGEQGAIAPERVGRETRWRLTAPGRRLLEGGARRIYTFGATPACWGGEWLVAHCPVPETHRAVRNRLRTRLAFEGFGELSPSLAVSPHVSREPSLRRILDELGLGADAVVLRSRTGSRAADSALVRRAWDLDALAASYREFAARHRGRRPASAEGQVRALVELVHDWRRFPFADPELPTELLPARWAGAAAAEVFADRRAAWAPAATAWFAEREAERATE